MSGTTNITQGGKDEDAGVNPIEELPQGDTDADGGPDGFDSEGHIFLRDIAMAKATTADRERELQRSLQKPQVEKEGRRPFFRNRRPR